MPGPSTPSTDENRSEPRPTGGTAMPIGASVWDVAPPPTAETFDQPSHDLQAVSDAVASAPTGPRPVAVAAPDVAIARNIEPTVPAPPVQHRSVPRRVVRRRRSALGGLLGVVTIAVAIIVAAGWFVSSGVDGADDDAEDPVTHTAPTVPAAGGALSAVPSPTTTAVVPATTVAVSTTVAADDRVEAIPQSEPPSPIETSPGPEPVTSRPESAPEPWSTTVPAPITVPVVEPVPSTVAAPTSTDSGPWVEITSRHEACRFGSDCLVVGFVLHDFEVVPGTFTCEFASGARHEFRATNATVDYACATGAIGDSITIEVAGIRSETVANS